MENIKKFSGMILALIICLASAACGGSQNTETDDVAGNDWRVTGVVRDSGTITRNNEDTNVLVCLSDDRAEFYYDREEQTLYSFAEYPASFSGDTADEYQSIDFSDRNGDGNSDVAIMYNMDDVTVLVVWYWNTEKNTYEFRPYESALPADGQE